MPSTTIEILGQAKHVATRVLGKALGTVAIVLIIAAPNAFATATSETFESIDVTADSDGDNQRSFGGSPRVVNAWTISMVDSGGNNAPDTGGTPSYLDVTALSADTALAGAGDNALVVNGHFGVVTEARFTASSGGEFWLQSFQIEGGVMAPAARVLGYRDGAQVASQDISLSSSIVTFTANDAGDQDWQNIDQFRVVQQDGTADIYFAIDDITVATAVLPNNAPTATGVPSDVTVTEDNASNFDLSTVTFTDIDGDALTVTLSAGAGTFAAASGGGVTVGGSGTGTLTLAGTAANINTFLDTNNIQYTSALNATGNDATTVTVNANDGTVNPSLGTINVDITAVNDDPSASGVPTDVNVVEDTASNLDLSAIALSDPDSGSGTVTLTIATSAGTISLANSAGLTFSGNATGTITISGAIATVDSYLNTPSNMLYTGAENVSGDNAATLTLTINDNGNTGSGGGANVGLGSVNVDITAANDAPTITSNGGGVTAATNAAESQTAATTVTATDVDGDIPSFSISGGADSALFSVNAATGELTFNSAPDFENPTDANADGIYEVQVTASDGNGGTDVQTINVTVTDVSELPLVTDANISISGATGTGGMYRIGDTVTATWNNTAGGDNNAGVSAVTVDFSQFGGGAAVAASNNSDTWTATYTIVSGAIDATNRNVSVTATNTSGDTTTADTTNATVDSAAPAVTDANISISGASGTGGAFRIGDTVTATWNNTAGGDNNSDSIGSVTVDFSAFGGGAAVAATNSSGIWTSTYTIVSGAIDGTNRNVSVTATDNAGNATTRADTTNATVDNVAPVVSDANISISGASGTGGAFIVGDTVTATWNNTAGGDNNSDGISSVTVDFSQLGGGAAVAATNSSNTWTATYTIVSGAIEGSNLNVSVTATDNANNATTTADTTNVTVDSTAPTIGSVSVPSSGTYIAGQNLDFTVNASENVTVDTTGGTPQLSLTLGATPRQAVYLSGSGTSAMVFRYTIQAGDTDADGIVVGTLSANGGTLQDGAGNALNTTLNSVGTTTGVLVDAVAPTISSVSVPANGTYVSGQNLDFTVDTSESITVNTSGGTPRIALSVGAATRYADYLSGSGTAVLVFRYVVQSGDNDADGIAVAASIEANGGTLRDGADNNLDTTLASVGATTGVLIDTAAPSGHSVSFDDSAISSAEASSIGFTFAGAEVGADYSYTISSSGGGTPVTGAGTIVSATDQISGIDVSGLSNGTLTLSVTTSDAAGNSATAVTATTTLDAQAPAPAMSSAASDPINAGFALNVGFGETVTEFTESDITVSNATLGGFTDNGGGNFTVTVTPNSDGLVQLDIAAAVAEDVAGNPNVAASQFSITYDGSAPIPVISSTASDPSNVGFQVDIAFGESVSGFAIGDITVSNASLSAFVDNGGGSYSVAVTPVADGPVVLNIAAGVAQDAGGNGNDAAAEFRLIYDGTAPALSSSSPADGAADVQHDAHLVLNFSESISAGSGGSVSLYQASDDSLIESIGTASSLVTISGGSASVDWSSDLTPTTAYYVLIGNDAFADAAGNAYAGIGDPSALNFTVANANPIANDDAATVNEDEVVAIAVLANDADVDSSLNAASTQVVSGPANGSTSVNTATGVITYTPTANFNGSDSFTYSVEDVYSGASNTATVAITVNAVNDAPTATADTANTPEDTAVDIDVAANDTDIDVGDSVDPNTIVIATLPADGAVSVSAGQVTYTPNQDFNGSDQFSYTIEDQQGAVSAAALVVINVTGVNDLPDAGDDTSTVDEDGSVVLDLLANDTDVDGSIDPATVTIMTDVGHGTTAVDPITGAVTYTPAPNYHGSDSFTYVVRDNDNGTSNLSTVSLTVVSVNDAPVAGDNVATLLEDTPHEINVLGNDSDVDGNLDVASVQVVTAAQDGSTSVDPATGAITYTPGDHFNGSDIFTYRVMDNEGLWSAAATVTLTVNAVNDEPLANDDSASTDEDSAVIIHLLTNDSDVDGSLDATRVVIVIGVINGSLLDNGDGTVTYTPDADFNGNESFTYTVADNSGAVSNTATVAITVLAVNDAPSISGTPSTTILAGVPYSFTPTLGDQDGDSLTVTASNLPAWAMLDASTGAVSGTPNNDSSGSWGNIVLSVSDGRDSDALPAFTIEVLRDTDGDGTEDTADTDDDGDGMPDNVEEDFGLDPLDPSDADADLDTDGVSNRDEYLAGSDPLADDYAPVFAQLEDIIVNATGLLTARPDITAPMAVDGLDGNLEATLATSATWFKPGLHQLTWTATDAAGNRAEAIQMLRVRPLISLSRDQLRGEGSTARVLVVFNGESPDYPLTVGYTLGGSADSADHDLTAGTVTFAAGELEQELTVMIASDGGNEGTETLRILLDESTTSAGMANFGARRVHEIRIVEHNVAPSVRLSLDQDGREARIIVQDGSPVTVTATVDDPNIGDTHSLDWELPDTDVISPSADLRVIDPSTLPPGLYRIEVTATEEGANPLSTSNSLLFRVIASAPVLETDTDNDGDGIDDASEGLGDSDGDGLPDYLDGIALPNVLNEHVSDGDRFLVEADSGLHLSIGRWALLENGDGVAIGSATIGNADGIPADTFINVGGYFDLMVQDIPELGASVDIVIPQRRPIPARPVYRKFDDGRWYSFVQNASNGLASALGAEGVCPPPGDAAYVDGLAPGHWCVQLTIEDGGPNDDDGVRNGTIADPGGVATPGPAIPHQTRSGGGGAVGLPAMLVLILLALSRAAARRHASPARALWAMALLALCLPSQGQAQGDGNGEWWRSAYITTTAGYATTRVSEGELQRDFAKRGIDAQVSDLDTSRSAWSLGVGWAITQRWAVEAGYRDLGEVKFNFDAEDETPNLAGVHPASGQGWALTGIYRYPLTSDFGLHARAGLFAWSQEFETLRSGVRVDETSESGTELSWGFGGNYRYADYLSLSAEMERIEFNREPAYLIAIGLQWRLQ